VRHKWQQLEPIYRYHMRRARLSEIRTPSPVTGRIRQFHQLDPVFQESFVLLIQNQSSTAAFAPYLYRVRLGKKGAVMVVNAGRELCQKGHRLELHQFTKI